MTSTNLVEGNCSEKEGGNIRRQGWTVPLREEEETGIESLGRVEGLLAFRDGRRRKMGRKGAG